MLADKSAHQDLINFFKTGTSLNYKKGEAIIRPGDEPRGIYYITSGFVKAYAITKYGEENSLIVRKDGEIFPFIWVFTGEHRDITYEAMCDTSLLRVAKSDFLAYLKANEHVTAVILDMAIDAYRLHSERVMSLEYRTVKERLASFLITHIERFGSKGVKGMALSAPIRRHDIASSINASRESTSRELSALARAGMIDLTTPYIEITNPEKLRELL
jgi:CRP/FNR family transcriptional regulator